MLIRPPETQAQLHISWTRISHLVSEKRLDALLRGVPSRTVSLYDAKQLDGIERASHLEASTKRQPLAALLLR
jgi:hypothetical protein